MMRTYDERRAEVRDDREGLYGSQWRFHLQRYGPVAYFYEMAGIMGRLEAMLVSPPVETDEMELQIMDKLLDLGNYASFIHDHIVEQRLARIEQDFKEKLP